MSDPLTWDELAPKLTGLASLASVTADGAPHVAVVSPAIVDDAIWIGSFRSARKAANVEADGRVALVWTAAAEVEAYVWGHAELVDDLELKQSFWVDAWSYDPAMFFDSPESPDYVLIRVTPDRAMTMGFGQHGPIQRRWRAGA